MLVFPSVGYFVDSQKTYNSVVLSMTSKLTFTIKIGVSSLFKSLIKLSNVLKSRPLYSPQVTTDKKSLAYVDNMLKKSNKKVEELHQELQELNAHIVVKDPEELLGNNRTRQQISPTEFVNINQGVKTNSTSGAFSDNCNGLHLMDTYIMYVSIARYRYLNR